MEVIKSERGKEKLLLGGYAYYESNRRGCKTYWCCDQKMVIDCKGTVITTNTEDNLTVKEKQAHNHDPDPDRMLCMKAKHNIKQRANSGTEKASAIVADILHDLPAQAGLPTKASLARSIRRHRQSTESSLLLDVIESDRGKEKLLLGGYAYFESNRREDNLTVKEKQAHNHDPDPDRMLCMKAKHNIKQRANSGTEKASAIVADILHDFPAPAGLPTKASLIRNIRRRRQSTKSSLLGISMTQQTTDTDVGTDMHFSPASHQSAMHDHQAYINAVHNHNYAHPYS